MMSMRKASSVILASSFALFLFVMPLAADECRAEPVIDVHLHFYDEARFWGPAPNRITGEMSPETAETHREETLRQMDENGIVLALANAPFAWDNHDTALLWHSLEVEHPDEIDIEALEEAVEDGRIRAIGEIGAQYQGISAADPRWEPLWDLAEKHDLPVAIHTGGGPSGTVLRSRPKFRYEMGDPLMLQDVLVEHPGMKVSMMHAGLDLYLDETLAMMHMYPDLYADIGVAVWVRPHMRRALDRFLREAESRGYEDRILFGTDQMIWPDAIPIAIETVRSRDYLSEDQKRGILFENAVRFLGLTDAERAELIERACN